jgi:hypothetical protein
VCAWEDDTDGVIYAADATGPNKASLIDAQVSFCTTGSKDRKLRPLAGPQCSYERDLTWRPIDLTLDGFERVDAALGFIGIKEKVRPWNTRFDQPYYWLW